MKYKDMLQIIEKYNNTKTEYIKNNLYDILKQKHLKVGFIQEILQVSPNTAKSYINQNIKSKPSLKNLLKLCIALDIDITELLKENIRKPGKTRGIKKRWTNESMQEYVNFYENNNITEVMKKYNLSQKTSIEYYRNFKNMLNNNEYFTI